MKLMALLGVVMLTQGCHAIPPAALGLTSAVLGFGAASLNFDGKIIDYVLAQKNLKSCPLPSEGAPK